MARAQARESCTPLAEREPPNSGATSTAARGMSTPTYLSTQCLRFPRNKFFWHTWQVPLCNLRCGCLTTYRFGQNSNYLYPRIIFSGISRWMCTTRWPDWQRSRTKTTSVFRMMLVVQWLLCRCGRLPSQVQIPWKAYNSGRWLVGPAATFCCCNAGAGLLVGRIQRC